MEFEYSMRGWGYWNKDLVLVGEEGDLFNDKIQSKVIRQKTKITDIVQKVSKLKWQWAGQG